ncbi:MAG: nitrate/sulfonate/bicarbonate ABC transporter ATP-binding protein [Actinobacteria bacterium]|nr:nitrate/sulfonate/bicarbonate ABC transporter ATP-binding protein [Actinomycetota bacterium]
MTEETTASPIVTVDDVGQTFAEAPILQDVNIEIFPGEIVALLGKSGSGKSTLLRCIAGLLIPTRGEVRIEGKRLDGPNPDTAMVFQTFALLPWLDVQQNVELGLEAQGEHEKERAEKAMRAIEMIGLDGFENAFPKELSGGMRQRVGFARALVTEPKVLLMDEPFSALDVLTAESLRNELVQIIDAGKFDISSVVIVTHNIEEALILADRVAVLGSRPGVIKEMFAVDLPRPRDRDSRRFKELTNRIYDLLASKPAAAEPAPRTERFSAPGARDGSPPSGSGAPVKKGPKMLPDAGVDAISGMADILAREGRRTIRHLADDLGLDVDDLFPQLDALELLGMAEAADGRIELTGPGLRFAHADIRSAKEMFAAASLRHADLVGIIVRALARSDSQKLPAGFFRDLLARHHSDRTVRNQMRIAISWGRYGELFTYHSEPDEFVLDHGYEQAAAAQVQPQ